MIQASNLINPIIWLLPVIETLYRLLWWCKWTQHSRQMSKCNVCQWELDLPPAVGRGLDCSAEHKSNRPATAMKYQVLPPLPSPRDLWHYEVTVAINLSESPTRLLPALSCSPASVNGLKQLCDRRGRRSGCCLLSAWLKQIGGQLRYSWCVKVDGRFVKSMGGIWHCPVWVMNSRKHPAIFYALR